MRHLLIALLTIAALSPLSASAGNAPSHLYGDHGPIGVTYSQAIKNLSSFQTLEIDCNKTFGKPGGALKCHGLIGDDILFHIIGEEMNVHFIEFYMDFPMPKADIELKLRILSTLINNAFNNNQAISNWFNSVIDRVMPKGGHDLVVFGDKQLVVEYRPGDKELTVSINTPRPLPANKPQPLPAPAGKMAWQFYGDYGPINVTYDQAVKGLTAYSDFKLDCFGKSPQEKGTFHCIGLYKRCTILLDISGKDQNIHDIAYFIELPQEDKKDFKVQSRILFELLGNVFEGDMAAIDWFHDVLRQTVQEGSYRAKTFSGKQFVIEYRPAQKSLIISINKPQ